MVMESILVSATLRENVVAETKVNRQCTADSMLLKANEHNTGYSDKGGNAKVTSGTFGH